ncbi:MAG: VWA domain-containing protein [Bradymonadaceae bacterium]
MRRFDEERRVHTAVSTLSRWVGVLGAFALVISAGCSSATSESSGVASGGAPGARTGPRGSSVGQAGARDIGRFRDIVERGDIPAPATLDRVGFFQEHHFDLSEPTCGENVCLHGMFGVQGNMIDGSNCTMVAVGFNSPRNPDDFQRPPLDLAVAIDVSGSMAGRSIRAVRRGLELLADRLTPEDRLVLVAYADRAEVVARSGPGAADRAALKTSVQSLRSGGSTNIYAGLRRAFREVDGAGPAEARDRVVLISDGRATTGIRRNSRILKLAETYLGRDVGLTTIGVGNDYDAELMRGLGELGEANSYYLDDPAAVTEVFAEEIGTALVPLAEEVDVRFEVSQAYQFRAAYGTKRWSGSRRRARIDIPALYTATRSSDDDVGPGGGRRGGGGVILLELVPAADPTALQEFPSDHPVGTLEMAYREPQTGRRVEQRIDIRNPLEPGAAPDDGEFTNGTVEKAFVALNVFAGLRMASRRASNGAAGAALAVLNPLIENVRDWNRSRRDADIRDDLALMRKLAENIRRKGSSANREEVRVPVQPPPNPWPND